MTRATAVDAPGTVLVVEDDAWVREVLAAALNDWGYGVLPASNGYTGLRLARQLNVDAVLLDIGLPELSGTEVLHMLRADETTHDLPVIIVSGRRDPVEDADRARVTAVFGKPFDLAGLRAAVARCAGLPGRSAAGVVAH